MLGLGQGFRNAALGDDLEFAFHTAYLNSNPRLPLGVETGLLHGLPEVPKQVACNDRTDDSPAIAERENQLVKVLDLQTVIQGVTKAMRPVKEREEAKRKQGEARDGKPDQFEQSLV